MSRARDAKRAATKNHRRSGTRESQFLGLRTCARIATIPVPAQGIDPSQEMRMALIDVRRVVALFCLAALLVFALAHSAAAQVPKLESLKASPPPEAQQEAQDPLGRTTPRGTLTEFLAAV